MAISSLSVFRFLARSASAKGLAVLLLFPPTLVAVSCASTTGPVAPESSRDRGDRATDAEARETAGSEFGAETRAELPEGPPDPSALFAPAGGEVVLSPDGDWFVDDQGVEYYLVEIPRRPEYSIHAGGKRVAVPPGLSLHLVEAREDVLVVKIFNPDSIPTELSRDDDSDLHAAMEQVEVETADRFRFESFASGLPDRGQWRQGFQIVDIDGDGHLDLVHGPARKGDGKPKIFLGDGAGGWRLWREATFESRPLDYGDVAVADFDLDGHLDLALAIHLRGLMVLLGDGEGHFRQAGTGLPYWMPGGGEQFPGYSSRSLEVVDWNRDGLPDLLALGEGPRLVREGAGVGGVASGARGPVLFLNRGEANFERYDQGTDRKKIFGDGIAVGDFDGDGLSDFAVASNVRGATHLVKMGEAGGGWADVALGSLVRRGTYGAVHAVDLDGDGRHELLLGYGVSGGDESFWAGIDLLEYENGAWEATPLVAERTTLDRVTALASGDLNQDGRTDIVALTDSGQRWILLGAPDGKWKRERSDELAPSEAGCRGYAAEISRIGEDGLPVLFMAFAGESGSEQLIPGLQKRCPSGGALEAWTITPSG